MSKERKKTEVENVVRNLHVELTAEEFIERSTDLAKALANKRGSEKKMASQRAAMKAEIEGFEAEINGLQQVVSEKKEWRNVECEKNLDYENKVVYFINTDTGERFDERKMRPDEMQETMRFE